MNFRDPETEPFLARTDSITGSTVHPEDDAGSSPAAVVISFDDVGAGSAANDQLGYGSRRGCADADVALKVVRAGCTDRIDIPIIRCA